MGDTNNHIINTGTVKNSMVGHEIKDSSIKVAESTLPRKSDNKVIQILFLLIAIAGTAALIILSTNGVTFNETAVSLFRLFIALSATPFLGTLIGSAIFKMNGKKNIIPFTIGVKGHLAIFFVIIVVLTLFKVPAVTTSANTDNDSWSNGAQKISSEVK